MDAVVDNTEKEKEAARAAAEERVAARGGDHAGAGLSVGGLEVELKPLRHASCPCALRRQAYLLHAT